LIGGVVTDKVRYAGMVATAARGRDIGQADLEETYHNDEAQSYSGAMAAFRTAHETPWARYDAERAFLAIAEEDAKGTALVDRVTAEADARKNRSVSSAQADELWANVKAGAHRV
jgi:hypothetical protein